MSGSKARLQAIEAVKGHEGPAGIFSSEDDLGEIFGENVFSKAVMQKRLPKTVFKSLLGDDRALASRSTRRSPTSWPRP